MTDIEFKKHNVEWTDEKVKRFWDFFVKNKSLLDLSFAQETGKDIIKHTRKYIKPSGLNLDYGCGGGALMGYLFDLGINCEGLDSSVESLETTKKRFQNNPYFKGLIRATSLPQKEIPSDKYDFLYFVETIEHIISKKLNDQLQELNRILKKGGYVFVSTPHDENIPKYEVLCPDCGAVFHRVQHTNSFTVESLTNLMDKAGFDVVFCRATLLGKNTFLSSLKKMINNLIRKQKKPHLIYLGKKR